MNKKLLNFIVGTLLATTTISVIMFGKGYAEGKSKKNWKLVWEDNFEGDSLNLESWNYETHEPGWVNNELQEYTDSTNNIYVKDGTLVIKKKQRVELDIHQER
ncbi:hypothetical protein [uncultured Clostridium sp.]|uniref:glycoside hydrolase family 16 protein n=1 Tax=uncultured Clostridium sp. TaxID=59620 RepID=UPI002614B0A1|nr:hypothetical protein [uncultured Clostridium sp.]